MDEVWLGAFSRGLLALADEHGCELVGGDTTRGPLNICITVFGEVPLQDGRSQALLRSGARAGDDLYVSGTLGDAALALDVLRGRLGVPAAVLAAARLRLERPSPRVALGQALRGIASAAIDVSDGLLGDLGHILKQSGVGATVAADTAAGLVAARAVYAGAAIPLDPPPSQDDWRRWALAGGDDYELLFAAPLSKRGEVAAAGQASGTTVTRIGQVDAQPGLRLIDGQGQPLANNHVSFDHFGP